MEPGPSINRKLSRYAWTLERSTRGYRERRSEVTRSPLSATTAVEATGRSRPDDAGPAPRNGRTRVTTTLPLAATCLMGGAVHSIKGPRWAPGLDWGEPLLRAGLDRLQAGLDSHCNWKRSFRKALTPSWDLFAAAS